jgi:y4mF family transcriptional regulator
MSSHPQENREATTVPDVPAGASETVVRSSTALGAVVRAQRKRLSLRQLDVADRGKTGNRFIVELESGKPTLQLQKVLDVMDQLDLDVVVRPRR